MYGNIVHMELLYEVIAPEPIICDNNNSSLSLASAPTSVVFDKNKKYYAHSDLRRARDAENLQSSLRERERTCAQVHCVLQCDLCSEPHRTGEII